MKNIKKLVLCFCAISLVLTLAFAVNAFADSARSVRLGDVNGDGEFDALDAHVLRKYFANYNYDNGTSSVEISAGADIDKDGSVTLGDLVLLRKGLVDDSFLPEEECEHKIASSTYNEAEGCYVQTCENCDAIILSPVNLVLDADSMLEYCSKSTNAKFGPPEVVEEDDNKFMRLTATEAGSAYFYPYSCTNTTVATGNYAIIKYRVSSGDSSSASWGVFASTVKTTAGSEEQRISTTPALYDDGNWHIAVIDLKTINAASWFAADENGDYYANFVRLDVMTTKAGATVDVEYLAFSDSLDTIANLTGEEDFGDSVACTHYRAYKYIDTYAHANVCAICGDSIEEAHNVQGEVIYNESTKNYLGECTVCGEVGSTPFNLYADAEKIQSYATSAIATGYEIANRKSAEYFAATEDDIAYTRLTVNNNKNWLYFYYYVDTNAKKVTGQYVVIKFRLPNTGYTGNTIGSYVGSATSPNAKATSGENFTICETAGTDGWMIAAYDMSKSVHYGANEDGTYSAKYLRIDFYVDQYIDVAYIGVCDNLDAIEQNIGENTACRHSIYNYETTVSTHAKVDCALCKSPADDTAAVAHTCNKSVYNEDLGGYVMTCTTCRKQIVQAVSQDIDVFFNPEELIVTEAKGGNAHFASGTLTSDETESIFTRFVTKKNTPYFYFVNNNTPVNKNEVAAPYLVIKYRYASTNSVKPGSINIYASSGETPVISKYITAKIVTDGEWHVLIVDLRVTENFVGDVPTLIRLDMYGWNTAGEGDIIDIAYAGLHSNIDELRALDEDYDSYGLVGSAELKAVIKNIATEKVDTEHNNLSYVTVTGSDSNYTEVYKNTPILQGTDKYVAVLYRKPEGSAVTEIKMYLSKNNATDKNYTAPYISDGKWHLTVFDMSQDEFYSDGTVRCLRFDWFNFSSSTVSIDVAYVKFFNSLDEAYAYYGEYVKTYFDSDNCDHYSQEWRYGVDDDPETDTFKEYAVCLYCGKQLDEAREVSFNVTLDKVTDSKGTYPSDLLGTIASSENSVINFNSNNFSELYPAEGLTVATGDDLSIAGSVTTFGAIDSIWYKVVDANGAIVSAWKECRFSLNGSKFAAYADFDGISGNGLTVVFAVVPTGLPETFTDRYLPIVTVENVNIVDGAEKQATFTASNNVGVLMDNVFEGNKVYNETVMFLDYGDSKSMMYYVDKIISVKNYNGTVTYVEGVDYALEDGKIVILEGSSMPCITSAVYYGVESDKFQTYHDGVATNTHYGEAWNMTNWQVVIEYEHSELWSGYEQDNMSDYYANFIQKLMNGEDVTIIYYGDSITAGANSSFMHGYGQKQYGYALLLTNAIADAFGYTVRYVTTDHMNSNMGNVPTTDYVGGTRGTITYINTAVGGKNSNWGRINVQEYVINYIEEYGCDLFICAFGMNDLDATASITRSNTKNIVDPVLAAAPDTSVMLVSTMFYNNVAVDGERRDNLILEQDVALKSLAEDYRNAGHECAVTSMSLVSQSILEHKDFMDYTGNNVNHPNDYFCRIYAQTLFEALIGYDNLAD